MDASKGSGAGFTKLTKKLTNKVTQIGIHQILTYARPFLRKSVFTKLTQGFFA